MTDLAARAFPPFNPPLRPSATAAGSFPSSGSNGGASPATSSTSCFASSFTSRERLRDRSGIRPEYHAQERGTLATEDACENQPRQRQKDRQRNGKSISPHIPRQRADVVRQTKQGLSEIRHAQRLNRSKVISVGSWDRGGLLLTSIRTGVWGRRRTSQLVDFQGCDCFLVVEVHGTWRQVRQTEHQVSVEQEAMIALWIAIRGYRPETGVPFGAFANVVIRRRLGSAIEAASAGKHRPLNERVRDEIATDDGDVLSILDTLPAPASDPARIVEDREWLAALLRIVREELSPLERRALIHVVNGDPYAGDKSIDNAIYRARRKLTDAMDEMREAVA